MSYYRLYMVDAFTDTPFAGNPAGVVSNAAGLSERDMQRIAREVNASETAFIFPGEAGDHEVRLRFFTPKKEVPMCGHATLAAHYVRARELGILHGVVRQKTQIGVNNVYIDSQAGRLHITMDQPLLEIRPVAAEDQANVLAALGIAQENLDSRFPMEVVNTGNSKVMVALKSRELLDRLDPDQLALLAADEHIGSGGYFLFTLDTPNPSLLSSCRMFAPQLGIFEDPVTGNGNGALGIYLARHGLLQDNGSGRASFSSQQGVAAGRPGLVQVTTLFDQGEPVAVQVGGTAVENWRAKLEVKCPCDTKTTLWQQWLRHWQCRWQHWLAQ